MPSVSRAAKAEKPKRQRKRKARTQVSSDSSSSSSDSDSSSSDEQPVKEAKVKRTKAKTREAVSSAAINPPSEDTKPEHEVAQQVQRSQAEGAFDAYYLRQITKEFAEDLDKVRSAADFKNTSIPMLVDALKQGRTCFTQNDRLSIEESITLHSS
ncbi:hypothetical protein AAFC00_004120 [Neodothiora populina]|uniref:Ribosome assembly protein 3 n=1 Tax=Neodothiora populina TaxID=2781224 RepID=A0ABR3PIL6_9PEZI